MAGSMRAKWFKRGEKWDRVVLTDDEEEKLLEKFIDEYLQEFRDIHKRVEGENLDHDQKFALALEIFKKLASPAYYKLESILEERRDAEMAKGQR